MKLIRENYKNLKYKLGRIPSLRDFDDYDLTDSLRKALKDENFRKIFEEVLDFGLYRNTRDYSETYGGTDLVLYRKYTYEDICHLLNWDHNEVPLNIGGYKYDTKTKTFPVFVNYIKDESVVATQQYEDQFTAPAKPMPPPLL